MVFVTIIHSQFFLLLVCILVLTSSVDAICIQTCANSAICTLIDGNELCLYTSERTVNNNMFQPYIPSSFIGSSLHNITIITPPADGNVVFNYSDMATYTGSCGIKTIQYIACSTTICAGISLDMDIPCIYTETLNIYISGTINLACSTIFGFEGMLLSSPAHFLLRFYQTLSDHAFVSGLSAYFRSEMDSFSWLSFRAPFPWSKNTGKFGGTLYDINVGDDYLEASNSNTNRRLLEFRLSRERINVDTASEYLYMQIFWLILIFPIVLTYISLLSRIYSSEIEMDITKSCILRFIMVLLGPLFSTCCYCMVHSNLISAILSGLIILIVLILWIYLYRVKYWTIYTHILPPPVVKKHEFGLDSGTIVPIGSISEKNYTGLSLINHKLILWSQFTFQYRTETAWWELHMNFGLRIIIQGFVFGFLYNYPAAQSSLLTLVQFVYLYVLYQLDPYHKALYYYVDFFLVFGLFCVFFTDFVMRYNGSVNGYKALFYFILVYPFFYLACLIPGFVKKCLNAIETIRFSKNVLCEGFDLETNIAMYIKRGKERIWITTRILLNRYNSNTMDTDHQTITTEEGDVFLLSEKTWTESFQLRNLWLTGDYPPVTVTGPIPYHSSVAISDLGSPKKILLPSSYEHQNNGEPVVDFMFCSHGTQPPVGYEIVRHSKIKIHDFELAVKKESHEKNKSSIESPLTEVIILRKGIDAIPPRFNVIEIITPITMRRNKNNMKKNDNDDTIIDMKHHMSPFDKKHEDNNNDNDAFLLRNDSKSTLSSSSRTSISKTSSNRNQSLIKLDDFALDKSCHLDFEIAADPITNCKLIVCAKKLDILIDNIANQETNVITDIILIKENERIPNGFRCLDHVKDTNLCAKFAINSIPNFMYLCVSEKVLPPLENMQSRFSIQDRDLYSPITDLLFYSRDSKYRLPSSFVTQEMTALGHSASLSSSECTSPVYLSSSKNQSMSPINDVIVIEGNDIPPGYSVIEILDESGKKHPNNEGVFSVAVSRDNNATTVVTDVILCRGGEPIPQSYKKISQTTTNKIANIGFYFRWPLYVCICTRNIENGMKTMNSPEQEHKPITDFCLASESVCKELGGSMTALNSTFGGYSGAVKTNSNPTLNNNNNNLNEEEETIFLCATKNENKENKHAVSDIVVLAPYEHIPDGYELIPIRKIDDETGEIYNITPDETSMRIAVLRSEEEEESKDDDDNNQNDSDKITGVILVRSSEQLPEGYVRLTTTTQGKQANLGSNDNPMFLAVKGKMIPPIFTGSSKTPISNILLIDSDVDVPNGFEMIKIAHNGQNGALPINGKNEVFFATQQENENNNQNKNDYIQPITDIKFLGQNETLPADYEIINYCSASKDGKPLVKKAHNLKTNDPQKSVKVCIKRFNPKTDNRLQTPLLTSINVLMGDEECPEGYEIRSHRLIPGMYIAVKKKNIAGDEKTHFETAWYDDVDDYGVVKRNPYKLQWAYKHEEIAVREDIITCSPSLEYDIDMSNNTKWIRLGCRNLPDNLLDVDMVNTACILSLRKTEKHAFVYVGGTEMCKDTIHPQYQQLLPTPKCEEKFKNDAVLKIEVFQLEDASEFESDDHHYHINDSIDFEKLHEHVDYDVHLRNKIGQILIPYLVTLEDNQIFNLRNKTGTKDLPGKAIIEVNRVSAIEAKKLMDQETKLKEREKKTIMEQIKVLRRVRNIESELKKIDKIDELPPSLVEIRKQRIKDRNNALKDKTKLINSIKLCCNAFFRKQKPQLGCLFEAAGKAAKGVKITSVHTNRAAHCGGLKKQDIVVSVDGKETKSVSQFRQVVVENCHVGGEYIFEVKRFGGTYHLNVLMGAHGVAMKTLKKLKSIVNDHIQDKDLSDVQLLRKLNWFSE